MIRIQALLTITDLPRQTPLGTVCESDRAVTRGSITITGCASRPLKRRGRISERALPP